MGIGLGLGIAIGRGHSPGGGASWWIVADHTCVAAYQAIGATSLAASYVNLANPGTYDLSVGLAPTFDASTGWNFAGANAYLSTGIRSTNNYTVAVRFSDSSTANVYLAGVYDSEATAFAIIPNYTGTKIAFLYGASTNGQVITTPPTSGVLINSRTDGYYNGIAQSVTHANLSLSTNPVLIGARGGGSPANFYSGKIQAVAIYSTNFDSTAAATLSTAMAAL